MPRPSPPPGSLERSGREEGAPARPRGLGPRKPRARTVRIGGRGIGPSYTIRSVPARGTDAIRCYMLARNAVHAAMSGRTNCVVGSVGDWYTLVPIKLATIERQTVILESDLWRSVMDATGQEFYFTPSPGLQMAP